MTDAFQDLSHAVAAHVKRAAPLIVGLDWGSRQQISAVLWQDGLVVTSEQSLPETDAAMAILPGGARVPALPIGRDASTNVAVLRVQAPAEPAQPHSYQPRPAPPDRLDIGALRQSRARQAIKLHQQQPHRERGHQRQPPYRGQPGAQRPHPPPSARYRTRAALPILVIETNRTPA